MTHSISLFALCILMSTSLYAHSNISIPSDTSRTVNVEEVVVVAAPKQDGRLRRSSTSVSLFSKEELQNNEMKNINDLSGFAPNFFMPSYGSSQTSAIYIRGIGSRINTPAVTIYVDNIPVSDKSAYNTQLYGVERIDVLRGPQGTLYGRNAMGGIIRIFTKNPFLDTGTTFQTGISTKDGGAYGSVYTNQKLSNKIAISAGLSYDRKDGLFKNVTTGKHVGGKQETNGRMRLAFYPNKNLKIDWTTYYNYIDEQPYPYFYNGEIGSEETMPSILHTISANRENKYTRNVFNTGVSVVKKADQLTLSSITSYQYLGDRTMMDQDFIYKDYYTLEQKQQSHAVTQEFVAQSKQGKQFEWTAGMFGMWHNTRTQAPVTFYNDGVDMLNSVLGSALPSITFNNPITGRPLSISQSLSITDQMFPIRTNITTPLLNGACFVQASLYDKRTHRFSVTAGLRLDYEHQVMNYKGGGDEINYNYSMQMIQPASLSVCPTQQGHISHDYTRLLPKVALKYDLKKDKGNVYFSIAQGHRSGGYNVQMFSDVMSSVMQKDMMQTTQKYCNDLLQKQADLAQTETMRNMFLGIKETMNSNMPAIKDPDVNAIVSYKPEYCWNYEAGTHLNFFDRTLTADFSLFYMDTHDQQISRFTQSGMGRMMVNAGHSHSCGAEMALRGNFLNDRLSGMLNYGYTHAAFDKYNAGNGTDYSGNKVPFIPEHNVGFLVDYKQPIHSCLLKTITIGLSTNGFGRIYWTEQNNAYQNFYLTAGAHSTLDFGKFTIKIWGKNLTQTKYHTFYFESMNRGYYQKGLPTQFGANISIKL